MKIGQNCTLAMALICILSFFGCSESPSPDVQSPAAGDTASAATAQNFPDFYELRIPDIYSPSVVFLPYIAAKKGFYEAEGIKPVFTGVIGPGQHVAAVVAKDNDVGFLHVNRTINGVAAGAPIKAVVANEETSQEYPHMEYVVLDEGPLKGPLDMVGKKVGIIAVGGCNEYTPYGILKKHGVSDPQGSIEVVTVPAGNEEVPLRTGDVDVVGFHGHPLDVFNNGGVRLLFDDYDVWGTEGGATPWYFHTDFIQEKPEAVRRFVAAHAKASKWINENREEAKKIQSEWTDIPLEKITITSYTEDGIITDSSVQIWIDTLKGYGELTKDLALSEIYTNEFNENSPDYKFNGGVQASASK
ncbi:MAG: ABC transporter substrate-binding protein [Deltaproteobacteria bacterium]|jgi:ABC-type nitrate/sulfonate/bicarbonate transport system substrate-binding protein|nr:ABC transporter substrate-binding protein [Deltaproteobacteria bacterium]